MKGRFSRTPAAAVFDPALSDKTLRVLAVLGAYADAVGEAHPSVPTIAEHLGMSDRQVQRHLRALEAAGYVVTERTIRHSKGGWGRNRYWLNFGDPVERQAAPVKVAGEVTSRVSPRDATSKASPREVTFSGERGDISRGGEVTSRMSDKQPNENHPIEEQLNAHAHAREGGGSVENLEMRKLAIDIRQVRERIGWPPGKMANRLHVAKCRLMRIESGEEALTPQEMANLRHDLEQVKATMVKQMAQDLAKAQKADAEQDEGRYHSAIIARLERAFGLTIGQAWQLLINTPDETRAELCRLVRGGRLTDETLTGFFRSGRMSPAAVGANDA